MKSLIFASIFFHITTQNVINSSPTPPDSTDEIKFDRLVKLSNVCNGAVIFSNPDILVVATEAHCFFDEHSSKQIEVNMNITFFGKNHITNENEERIMTHCDYNEIIYPSFNYDSPNKKDDIALLIFQKSSSAMLPLPVIPNPFSVVPNHNCISNGNATIHFYDAHKMKDHCHVQLIDEVTCRCTHPHVNYSHQLCASDVGEIKMIRKGHSGSPLVCNSNCPSQICGMVSHGSIKRSFKSHIVFTNVTMYSPWIICIINALLHSQSKSVKDLVDWHIENCGTLRKGEIPQNLGTALAILIFIIAISFTAFWIARISRDCRGSLNMCSNESEYELKVSSSKILNQKVETVELLH